MPRGKCALCHEYKELELSHIVPKFVIRHLKKTSFGAIRNMENPNMVVQDGEKHYMLCGDCEDLFSTYETKFANKFFYPYMNKGTKVSVKVLAPLIIPRIVLKYPSKARICFTRINLFFIFNFHIFRNLIIPRHKIL